MILGHSNPSSPTKWQSLVTCVIIADPDCCRCAAGLAAKPTMAERLSAKLPKSAQREQEDAHEFFNFLVDGAHEELLRLRAAHAQLLGQPGQPCSAIHAATPRPCICS